MPGHISPKRGICRSQYVWFPFDVDGMTPLVGAVIAGAASCISGPFYGVAVVMRSAHAGKLKGIFHWKVSLII